MLLETVSMVFSGAQPDKWDRKLDKVQEPISHKIIDATVNLLLSNVRSLKKHHEDVEALLSGLESPINLLCLTETWLREIDDVNLFKITGFHTIITNTRKTRGGGTMIQLGDKVNLLEQLESGIPESLSILVEVSGKQFIVVLAYVPPRYDKIKFVDELDKELERLAQYKVPIILTGDINIDTLQKNKLQQSYLNTITANGFELMSKSATRISDTSETCIDHFIIRSLENPTIEELDNECFSDHYPIILKFNFGFKGDLSSYSYRDMSFLTKENKLKKFLLSLKQNLEDENLISDNNIDLAYKKFNHSLMKSKPFCTIT